MSNRVDSETPSMAKVIRDAIEQRLAEVHVSMPGIVVSYDGQYADVQPALMRKYVNETTPTKLPIIKNVPVVWPSTKLSSLTLPLNTGDEGVLVFSERSLDKWILTGGIMDPRDARKHHLSDAQFIPGRMSKPNLSDYSTSEAVVVSGLAKLSLSLAGMVALGNKETGIEALDLMDKFMDEFISHLHPTAVGPSGPPANAAAVIAIKAQLATIKGSL